MDIINNKVDKIKDSLLNDIIELVKIPSIEGEAKENYPFGIYVAKALNKSLEISKKLGFKTVNLDNYIGYAEYGEGENYICAIGHIDVVPEGKDWEYPPYEGIIKNGKIYGRGVLDNKGPIISCLYGLYVLKELNLKLNKKVRIIFGCNEETGFKDIPYYLEREKPPLMGFTPDCKYPVVYGEKGMAKLLLKREFDCTEEEFKSFTTKLSDKINITYENLKVNKDELLLEIKVKYDFSYKIEYVLSEINSKVIYGTSTEVLINFNPVYFDKESKLVKSLQKAYERVTLLDGTPVTTNGGTYAKLMPNIVPFGPSFEGQKGIAHNPNEYMDIDDIMLNTKIFANAIYELVKE